MLTDIFIGGMAGIISRSTTAPIELYKIQCQNQYLKHANIRAVIKKEGIRYLWKGNLTNCMRVFPQFAAQYTTFENSKQHLFHNIKTPIIQNFLSGGVAGMVSMISMYPLETIRTRISLQMNKSHYSGPINALRTLKIRELYRGLGISILGFAPFSALNFTSYYYIKNWLEHWQSLFQLDNSSNITKLIAGGTSGIVSLSVTYPTDLLRRHFQMAGFNNSVPQYNGILDGFKCIVRKDGFRGLYRGLSASYIRIFPCLAIQFWCLDKGAELFH